jgi:hypothetical protein
MPMDVNTKVEGCFLLLLPYLHSKERIWVSEEGNTTYKNHLNKLTVFADIMRWPDGSSGYSPQLQEWELQCFYHFD